MNQWRRKLLFRRRKPFTQMELGIQRAREPDRNYHKGGRSFYFFDFDDNIAFLSTPTYLFHKETNVEVELSSQEFVVHSASIGQSGPYADYKMDFNDKTGTFRCFRDQDIPLLERVLGRKQTFLSDLATALGYPDFRWQGPSWSCFYHAVFNGRPISVITARGHHPRTLKSGIRQIVRGGHLPCEPNYLSLYPVNHPATKIGLSSGQVKSVPQLKQAAIRASVERALKVYGYNPHHRFGMSDDDPSNIQLIVEEMARLKANYREMSFFVIDTGGGKFVKREVFADHTEDQDLPEDQQLSLFRK